MLAAKMTPMSNTFPPPLASAYLPTFSMLLLLTSTYATETGPVFASALEVPAVTLVRSATAATSVPVFLSLDTLDQLPSTGVGRVNPSSEPASESCRPCVGECLSDHGDGQNSPGSVGDVVDQAVRQR